VEGYFCENQKAQGFFCKTARAGGGVDVLTRINSIQIHWI
jgi:hypothetical protein